MPFSTPLFNDEDICPTAQPSLTIVTISGSCPVDSGQCSSSKTRLYPQKSSGLCVLDFFGGPTSRSRVGYCPAGGQGLTGPDGTTSFAASSQTVNTKSICGAPGFANSSQLLLRRPSVGK